MAQYLPALHQAIITVSNDPADTFSLSGVGYLVTDTPFALTSLNRTTLPPSAFVPSGILDGTTLAAAANAPTRDENLANRQDVIPPGGGQ